MLVAEKSGSLAGQNNPLLAGNACSLIGSTIVLVLISHAFPNKELFNWEVFKTSITKSDDNVRS